jgi:hypothetical protein
VCARSFAHLLVRYLATSFSLPLLLSLSLSLSLFFYRLSTTNAYARSLMKIVSSILTALPASSSQQQQQQQQQQQRRLK